MTYGPSQALRGPRFTAEQRRLLDAVGAALKRRQLSFALAAELGERVKAGELEAVERALEALSAAR